MTIYHTQQWKKIRKAVLARDRYTCQLHLQGCKTTANAVDHIIDWRDGGSPYDPTNLRATCTPCNTSQRNQRVAQRARAQRQSTTTVSSRHW